MWPLASPSLFKQKKRAKEKAKAKELKQGHASIVTRQDTLRQIARREHPMHYSVGTVKDGAIPQRIARAKVKEKGNRRARENQEAKEYMKWRINIGIKAW